MNAKRTPKLGEENLKRDEEILLHAGNIFDYQNPLELWKYIKRVTESKRKIKIKFIGTVAPAIKNSLNDLGLSNQVEYVGFLSYSEMIAELYNADYLMVCASEPRHVPGKLFEYLRTRKPIIAFGDGNAEIKQILTDANAGMLFNYSQDGHEFFETASKFSTDLSYIKQFDRREIAHQLATIMN
ncbi:MAG: glycosyltransferase [Ignavibacteriaceae bacterium]|nr:glycosyltransferase [Ignavibacteriaceae bacterium]